MLKRFLLCLVVVSVCSMSQNVFSQDLFLSFGQGADVGNTSLPLCGEAGTAFGPGTAFLYARNGFNFDAIDVNVTSSDPGVATITDSVIFNSLIGGFVNRYNDPVVDGLNPDGSVRFFGASFADVCVDTRFAANDEDFDAVANAFLVGEVQFDIVDIGGAELEISLGDNAILLNDGSIYTNPDFGSATVRVPLSPEPCPEPSSVAFLTLGLAGMVTRRRRR